MFCWFLFFKQKTAYEMRISDWSSDVCSSDLGIASYCGTFLESSIGTSAGLQVAAAERSVTFGSEFIGGIWLADEIVTEPLVYRDFHVFVPTRPGIGMTLDRDKFEHYRRK